MCFDILFLLNIMLYCYQWLCDGVFLYMNTYINIVATIYGLPQFAKYSQKRKFIVIIVN